MIRLRGLIVLAGWLLLISTVSAQAPPARFHWQAGQVFLYRAEQTTTEIEVVGGSKVESWMRLGSIKRWQVLAVDAGGVATLQQSLTGLRLEKKTPSGATVTYDSANPDKNDPEMQKALSKYIGAPLATLRIDGQGKVIEVKESKYTPASRYENEMPFALMLPPNGLQKGQTWERTYEVTLEPPLGTGEKYPAAQKYVCKDITGNLATIAVTTAVKAPAEDQVPLIQFQPEGEVIFDLQTGCVRKVRMGINKELKNHHGDDSSYHFQSSFAEEQMGN